MIIRKHKVIAILDKKRILIDYGRNNKASKRDFIRVIEVGPEIKYDDRVYGTLDKIKASLSIDTIYDKFSICTNSDLENGAKKSLLGAYPSDIKIYENLNVNEEQISGLKEPDATPISLGDTVEIIKFN